MLIFKKEKKKKNLIKMPLRFKKKGRKLPLKDDKCLLLRDKMQLF
jgi:hypothetical protein